MDARYGAPPAPPSMSGSIPSQRLPSQCTPHNPPACVQNAMMTKDKKPFTYTPSGIDLSQIKSDRMAKRLARNAQMEGVGTSPKPNPYAQQAMQQHSPGLAQSSLGMPVQVFPTGPPPPPPPQTKGGFGGPPPPPPQPSKNHLAPQTNGAAARKSPSPQNFDPPPMGCRPEIKIPPNPMAALKKVPKPVEKNDFWIEEYRKDRSKSPMIESSGQGYDNQHQDSYNSMQGQNRTPSPPPAQKQLPRAVSPMRSPPVSHYHQPQQQNVYQTQLYDQNRGQSPIKSPAVNQAQLNDQNRGQSPLKSPAVNQTQHYDQNRGQSPLRSPAINQTQQYDQYRGQSPIKSPAIAQIQSQYQQQTRQQSPIRTTFPGGQIQPNRVESPFQSPLDNPNLQRPLSPVRVSQQQQKPYPRSAGLTSSPPEQQQQTTRNAVGSLYIPPVAPENLATRQHAQILANQQQQLHQQQLQQQQLQQQQQISSERKGPPPNRWISAQPTKDVPDWARENDTTKQQLPQSNVVNSARPQQVTAREHSHSPPMLKTNHMNSGLRLQMTNNVQPTGPVSREHIIPIQLEQTPTPTRSPATPGFGPQPYQNSNQQYSSVSSPGGNSPGYVIRNPNQFVDQGYNNYGGTQQQQQSPAGGARIIPMRVEGQDSPFNSNNARGPLSQSPMVMQNGHYNLVIHDIPLEAEIRYRKSRLSDPRTLQHQNSWGNNGCGPNGPNQSKSFRILQKITDTEGIDDNISSNSSSLSAVTAANITNNKQYNDNNYDQSSQLQRPQYSRQMSSTSSGIGNGINDHHHQQQQQQQQQFIDNQTEQIRRMQVSNNDQDYMNHVRNYVDAEKPSTNIDDIKNRVTSIPPDQIHILHDILDHKLKEEGLNIGDNSDTTKLINDIQINGTPPVMRQPQTPRYVQQRPYQFNEDQNQQYVHPSKQQVSEPKIYTGSAIPSRSFKLLQAMTTPENAAEMEGSDVVDYKQISNSQYIPYPPYPYPYGYPYPPPYQYPSIDPNNWPYPPPPYPPYYYYYPDYDSQNFHHDHYANKPSFFRHRSLSQERFRDYRRDNRRDSAPPNIIVTPSFDEAEENRFNEESESLLQHNYKSHETLNISKRPDYTELNISKEEDKTYAGENKNKIASSPSPNYSSSSISNSPVSNDTSVIENNEIKNTNVDGETSSSEDDDEEFDEIKPFEQFWGTKSDVNFKSAEDNNDDSKKENYKKAMDFFRNKTSSIDLVLSANDTVISPTNNKNNLLNKHVEQEIEVSLESNSEESDSEPIDKETKTIKSVNSIQIYNENDDETAIEDGSEIFDTEDEIVEEFTDNESEDEDASDDIEEIIIQDTLSVIYEESEVGVSNGSEKKSTIVRQTSESFSETSTTIGNEAENSENDLEDDNKDDENSVTVRLPLRLSFSKSSNDENITTVEVGKSEIDDQTKSFSIASIDDDDDDFYSDDPNISITLSLSSSRSGSFDKPDSPRNSNQITQIKKQSNCNTEDDEDDVSVSFSLSMRNKFLFETLDGDLTNVIAENGETQNDNLYEAESVESDENDEDHNTKTEIKDDDISILLSPSYKNIWQSFGTTLKDIATKEISNDKPCNTNNVRNVNNLTSSGDDVEDFWANIKEARKREATPDFWASIKENKDEIIVEPIDEDDEIVESIHDSDDDNIGQNDFWASIEKSKRDATQFKNNIEDFWGLNQDTEELCKKNRSAVNEFWNSKLKENQTIENNLTNLSNNDFWVLQNENYNISTNCYEKSQNENDIKINEIVIEEEEEEEEEHDEEEEEEQDTEEEEQDTEEEEEQDTEEEEDEEEEIKKQLENKKKNSEPTFLEKPMEKKFVSNPAYTSKPSNICPTYYSPPINDSQISPFTFTDFNENTKNTNNDVIDNCELDQKRSVRDKIKAFENGNTETSDSKLKLPYSTSENIVEKNKDMSRTSSLQRSESEFEEDDSGVTDMSKQISETDTESECFPELRKMTRYQRVATHSRLFKLLQEESENSGLEITGCANDDEQQKLAEEFNCRSSRKKIVHNVSITRRSNPDALKDAETMSQRRERLSLPLKTSSSIDSDNLSTSNSPTNSNSTSRQNVSEQLVNELVQSLLLKKNTSHLKNLPMEKLKAAAKRVLEEDLDSLENTSLESTPALTPQEFKTDSYTEYYDTWNSQNITPKSNLNEDIEMVPSKSLKIPYEQSTSGKRKPWGVRCPRVLSSKTINRDLTRVSESPENFRAASIVRSSAERDNDNGFSRASSITRRKL